MSLSGVEEAKKRQEVGVRIYERERMADYNITRYQSRIQYLRKARGVNTRELGKVDLVAF